MIPIDPSTDQLIRTIYEAVSRDDAWPMRLSALCRAFRLDGVVLAEHDVPSGRGSVREACRHLGTRLNGIYGDAARLDGLWLASAAVNVQTPAVADADALLPGTAVSQRYYDDFLRPQGFEYGLWGAIGHAGGHVQVLTLMRRGASAGFGPDDRMAFARLLPHLQQAVTLDDQIRRVRSEREGLLTLLDRVGVACFLVVPGGQLRFLNKAAAVLLDRRDGVLLRGGCLSTDQPRQALQLRSLIARAAGRPDNIRGFSMTLGRPSDRLPLFVTVFGVNGTQAGDEPLLAVLIHDPDRENLDSLERFADAYRLTDAEARLIALLARGSGLFEAARLLGVTRNTVRTHMRHVYAKIGAHRQADLMRLLGRLGIH